ncbi:SPOR domain-containing protein [Marispirochaeta sp.]|uniref:SPOR domain-containing protein n=1 Tax=Marispirochaeta sp. TaxID=2038653 RepID=UPI0029C858C2|nr:SPOR domain-containing protein [Marispirochaeta sp.]
MEQQKLLWIVFALATGFLVVVAAAFILFVPPAETSVTEQSAAVVDKDVFDVTDYLKNGETPLKLEEPPDEDTSFVIGIADEEASLVPPAEQPGTEAVESAAAVPEPKPAVEVPKVSRAPEPAPVPAKPTPAKKVTITEYWIQAGSFTQRASAERARESLKEKEFDSVIFTRTINGTDYFRVRIGPYRHKAEAEKFLSYVKNISSFEGSQIFEVYVEKTL